ncbi:hypothetical protein [Micromonospora okii]|uniref:hypothetical protein n=1 Tax=Micromonospora okii TaxID=1182970 RepID=UPI001E5D84C3|nr:hypothetical protein [Micromonospora okii]
MGGTDPGSARQEAERLVATVLAAARLAGAGGGSRSGSWGSLGGLVSGVLGHGVGPGRADGAGHGGFATGTPECCVCPVCRGIAALRDPSPEFAERLATGAGDLAAGVASLLRAFASAGDPADRPGEPHDRPGEPDDVTPPSPRTGAEQPPGDHVWREATRTGHDSQPAPERDVWSAATRGEGSGAPAAVVSPAEDAGPDAPGAARPTVGRPVAPASRTPGDAGGDAPGDGA